MGSNEPFRLALGRLQSLGAGRLAIRPAAPHTPRGSFDSEADAWSWLATVEADISRGVWRPVGSSTVTLDGYAQGVDHHTPDAQGEHA